MNQSARITLLITLFCVVALIAITSGKYSLTTNELWTLVSNKLTGNIEYNRTETVFWQIRFPRVLAAILIGGGLAIAGAAYQGMFRNPLVSPDILGVSSGAGVGAVLGIFLGQSMLSIQLFAFAGGLATVALVYFIARLAKQHDPVLSLVLHCYQCTMWLSNFINENSRRSLYSTAFNYLLALRWAFSYHRL